jgi:hypothetical protein
VFFEQITTAERVLITVLYQRHVHTRKALAELFEVTPTTIGIACRRIGPLPEQDGYIPAPAPSLHTTATALLDSVTPQTTHRNQHNRRVNSLRLPSGAQRFLSTFSGISPHFRPRRYRLHADEYRREMAIRFTTCNQVLGLSTTA